MRVWTRFRGFIDDVVKELKRTSWPSRSEVQGTTAVVVVTVLIVAFYLGAVDVLLAFLQQKLLIRFGAL